LSAGKLAQARGLVQCGPCGRTFSALSFLYDEWPEGEPCRPDSGPGTTLPVLEPAPEAGVATDEAANDAGVAADDAATDAGAAADEAATDAGVATDDAATDAGVAADEAANDAGVAADDPATDAGVAAIEPATDADQSTPATETGDEEPPAAKDHRLAWRLATVLLALVTVANLAWTFRQPLLDNPTVGAWFKQPGEPRADEHGLLKDPAQIQLVSRDMHTHPTRSGILVLSLTFVNLASGKQEYPQLEVTLTDASNQPVARRRLQPAEYLRPGADIDAGLAADVYLPVLLELGDPGEQAVGFEIRFL